jgi:Transposase DDE domain group 1
MDNATPFLPGLSPVAGKSLTAARDAGNVSSNGGLIVLREIAARLGIADVIAAPLIDTRNPVLIRHTYADMALARMMAIAAGYEDCDDLDALRKDPALKIACGRAPETGADIASQPTLSRLENLPDWRTLARIGLGMIDLFARSFAVPPDRIILDIDDTDDPVHGQQELALFNTHAGGHCFQPILIFDGISGKPIAALLRPGKRPSGEEAARVLRHVIKRIRRTLPKVRILVRGDSHYCSAPVLKTLGLQRCDYILGLAINETLKAKAAPWKARCETRRLRSYSARKVRRFHQFKYAAGTWDKEHRVIARVEATTLGTDARFVVTNLKGRAKWLYDKVYCARGNAENLIKDMKLYTRSDKTACTRRAPHAKHDGRPISSGCSCTWAPTGCCTRCDARRPGSRRGMARPSKRSAPSS